MMMGTFQFLCHRFWKCRRRLILIGVVCLVFQCFPFLLLGNDSIEHHFNIRSSNLDDGPSIISSSKPKVAGLVHNRTKIILYWNLYFGVGRFFTSKIDRQALVKAGCPVTHCEFIDDVEQFDRSDVVIFFAHYLYDVPSYRFPHQHFIFFQMESPAIELSDSLFRDRTRYDFFNRTMTYRLDSDIVLRELHGEITPKRVINLNSQMNYAHRRINSTGLWRNKTKMVAWFASNCKTVIEREKYVQELGQYIPVDIYGKCGNLTCDLNDWRQCFEMVRSDYKFYLAFENSWCPDYVTEKFFRPLYYDTVPIVMGGADYSAFAPPHSYINAQDFDSIQELVEYLLLLDKHEDLYDRYFHWKEDYKVNLNPMDGWCDLCQFAHDPQPPTKSYPDINKWWVKDRQCEDFGGYEDDWMEWQVVDE